MSLLVGILDAAVLAIIAVQDFGEHRFLPRGFTRN